MNTHSGVQDAMVRAEAASAIQVLLDHQSRCGLFDLDPARLSAELVARVAGECSAGGDHGSDQGIHRLALAACALAEGLSSLPDDEFNRNAFATSLASLLAEVQTNSEAYEFSCRDTECIRAAAITLSRHVSKVFPWRVETPAA